MIWLYRVGMFFPLSWASFNTPIWYFYPTLYSTVAGLCTATGVHLGMMAPPVRGAPFLDAILVSRVVGAAASLGTLGLVGCLGTRAFGPATGLLAAAFFAVVPVDVLQVHFASVDPMLTLWMTATLVASYGVARSGSWARVVLAGVAAGLATATKFTGAAGLAVVAWSIVESALPRRAWGRACGQLLVAVAITVVTAVIACTACVLQREGYLREMARLQSLISQGGGLNSSLTTTLGWYGRPYLYQLVVGLPFALGLSLSVVAAAGIAVAALRRTVTDRLLAVAIVPYFAIVGGYGAIYPRYLMPLVPPLVLLAARALVGAGSRPRVRTAVAGVVVIHTLVFSASMVARFAYDQQVDVARWVAAHAATTGNSPRIRIPDPWAGYSGLLEPLAREHLKAEPAPWGHWLEQSPDVFLLPEWAAIYVRRTPVPAGAAELEALEAGVAGYEEARRWAPSWFLHEDVYGWLDPGLRTEWYGRTGVRVYVRAQ